MSRFVSQVVLCGANRPHNVALIVPDWAAVRTELGLPEDAPEEDLVNDVSVKTLIDKEIHMSAAGKLKKFEIPQKWAVVAPFTAANNMLTPKMSVRRHVVVKAYENVIQGLYDDDDTDTTSTTTKEEDKAA
jgi:long-chain acyl-CoA synthetase